MKKFFFLVWILLLSSSCRFSVPGFGFDSGGELRSSGGSDISDVAALDRPDLALDDELAIGGAHQLADEGMELRQARIRARLDELEDMILHQKEKIRLLEQGLMLGINPAGSQEAALPEKAASNHRLLRPGLPLLKELKGGKAVQGETEKEGRRQQEEERQLRSVYKARLVAAKELFRTGKYGKAYLEFSKMSKEFDSSIHQHEPEHWIGRCWFQLREYEQARQYLKRHRKKARAGLYMAATRYWQARTEMELGMKETALKLLKELIREHPLDGAAEAARQLLNQMSREL